MATTVNDIIKRAMRIDGILGTAQTLDANDANDALVTLNQMLEQWSLEELMCYRYTTNLFNTSIDVASYTIGTGGTWVTGGRPTKIDAAFIRIDTTDSTLDIVNNEQYQAIELKTLQGIPTTLYYQPEYPLGKVYLYPVPDAVYPVGISQVQKFSAFASLSDPISLPPGYEAAIIFNLAIELSSEYGKSVDAVTARKAIDYKASLKRKNQNIGVLCLESALLSRASIRNNFDINAG